MKQESKYMPVNPDFYDIINSERPKDKESVVHFFVQGHDVSDIKGKIKELITTPSREEYLVLGNGKKARLDRIIVLNGRPGPAYDEYDSYALACLDCMGGMD